MIINEYLEPKSKLYCQRDVYYNVILLHIQFDGCIPVKFCIWSNQKLVATSSCNLQKSFDSFLE